MKRLPIIFTTVLLLVLVSVPAFAAPALPGFVSGTNISVPYEAQTKDDIYFLETMYTNAKIRPYFVLASHKLALGITSTENLLELSGKYEYLHFVKPKNFQIDVEIKNSQTPEWGPLGFYAGPDNPFDVLTFRYDPLTHSFDNGTMRRVTRGIVFEYVLDSSPLSVPTDVYPGYRRAGNMYFKTPAQYPYAYWLNIKGEETPTHKLTIQYVYEDGRTAAANFERTYQIGDAYSVDSPKIAGYYPSLSVIKGNMSTSDLNFTVTYKKNEAYQTKTKTLTILYVFEDGTKAWDSKIITDAVPGYIYRYLSPRIPGYAADRPIVEGYMPGIDWTETVVYKKIGSGQPDPPPYYYLTINYLRRNGQMITRPTTLMLLPGSSYSVRSPLFSYHEPDRLVASGTMPSHDVVVNVYYDETDSPNAGEGDKDDGQSGGSGGQDGGSSSSGSSGGSSGDSSGDGSGTDPGGSSSGGDDGPHGGGSGDSGDGGGSSSGSSSGSGSGDSGGNSGNSGPGGGSSGGSGNSSGNNGSCVNGNCNCGSSCGGSCGCGGGGQYCPGGGYWRPGADDFDNLFPDAAEPDTNYPPFHLFDPNDYDYIPPASSNYDPLDGVTVPNQMPRYPDKMDYPDYGDRNPLAPPNVSGGSDPLAPPNVSGGSDPLAPPNISGGSNPLAPPNVSGGSDPLAPPNVSGSSDPLAPPNVSGGSNPLAPPVIAKSK